MRALIYEAPGALGAGALDVAGRSLLMRQIQWLRELGIEDLVVEVTLDPSAAERAAFLLGSDPLVARCAVLPTDRPVGVEVLAERAGLAQDELFLALPANLIAHAHFEPPALATTYLLSPPPFAAGLPARELAVRGRARVADTSEPLDGWALPVSDLAAAHALSCAALAGQADGVLVHGAEVKPGIWLARGARVAEDATLLAPILIGAEARVFSSSRLGPNVVLGRGVVIERDTVLSDVSVAPGTFVGEGARARQAHLDPDGMTSLADGSRTEVQDALLLTRASPARPGLASRALALLVAAVLVVPWMLGSALAALFGRRSVRALAWHERPLHVGVLGFGALDLVPALWDVVLGRRDLIGVAQPGALELVRAGPDAPTRAGAIDVSDALAPRASPSTLLWMWRWYLLNKSPALDRELVRARRGAGAR